MNYYVFQILRTIAQSATSSFSYVIANKLFKQNNYRNNFHQKNRIHMLEMKEKKEIKEKERNNLKIDVQSSDILPSGFIAFDNTPIEKVETNKTPYKKRKYNNQIDILRSIL